MAAEDLALTFISFLYFAQNKITLDIVIVSVICIIQDVIFRESTKNWTWLAPERRRYIPEVLSLEIGAFLCLVVGNFFIENVLSYFSENMGSLYIEKPHATLGDLLIEVLVIALAMDAYFYAAHFSLHHKSIYNYIHKLHHRSKALTPFSSFNFSVLEVFVMTSGFTGIMIFSGSQKNSIYLYSILAHFANIYYHLGVEIAPSWFCSNPITKQFVTYSFHQNHHIDPRTNLGLHFTFWDRLFGTMDPSFDQRFSVRWNTPDAPMKK